MGVLFFCILAVLCHGLVVRNNICVVGCQYVVHQTPELCLLALSEVDHDIMPHHIHACTPPRVRVLVCPFALSQFAAGERDTGVI